MSLDLVDKVLEVMGRDLVLTTRANLAARVRTKTNPLTPQDRDRNVDDGLHTNDPMAY